MLSLFHDAERRGIPIRFKWTLFWDIDHSFLHMAMLHHGGTHITVLSGSLITSFQQSRVTYLKNI
jgi:hypothetical protein